MSLFAMWAQWRWDREQALYEWGLRQSNARQLAEALRTVPSCGHLVCRDREGGCALTSRYWQDDPAEAEDDGIIA